MREEVARWNDEVARRGQELALKEAEIERLRRQLAEKRGEYT
jgi:hypothetical protein